MRIRILLDGRAELLLLVDALLEAGMMDDERTALERALHGLDYPAPRNKLVSVAIANGAGPEVIERLRQLPETADYRTEADLRGALGVTIPGVQPGRGWE